MNPQNLFRSVGLIDDVLVRPFNRFSQRFANRRGKTFIPSFSGRNAVQRQVGSGTPTIRRPASINSPAYTQGGAQRFAAEYGTKPPNVPAAAANASRPSVRAPKGVSPYVVGGTAVGGGMVLGGALAATNQIEGALNQVGPAIDRFFGAITPQAIQNFGREQEDKGWGGALEMATPFGFLAAPFIPNTPAKQQTPMQRAQVGQPMVLGGRLGYKSADGSWQPRGDMESENIPQYLPGSPQADKSGYVWDPARQPAPGNQPPGSTPAAAARISPEERAYNEERSRIAQLTAQNPEFRNIGQLRNDLRDQGMAIWQQKYGNTPMAQQGGAVGMFNPLMDRTFGYQSGSAPGQQMGAPTLGPSPLVPQIDQSLNPASPNFIGGEGAPLMNFADPRFENMSPEDFQKLLNQVNKK